MGLLRPAELQGLFDRNASIGAKRAAGSGAGHTSARPASPVVEFNRAVAVARAFRPQAGLDIVDALRDEPTLARYYLLPSVRGDLLARLGRTGQARAEFERAAAMTRNERERQMLLERAGAGVLP